MAKLNFEEYLKAMEGYRAYLNGETKELPDIHSEEDPKPEEKPVADPKPEEKGAADPEPEKNSGDDVQKQLDEIKAAMGIMAKALQPSLGDIKPVGIDDVVKKFFDVE